MKLFMTLFLVSASAFAQFDDMNDVEYVSWCQDNKIMNQTSSGANFIVFDCSEEEKVCRHFQRRLGHRLLVTAACIDKHGN